MTDGDPKWGANRLDDNRWRIALWSPDSDRMDLALGDLSLQMDRGQDGWHYLDIDAEPGTPYAFVKGGREFPDPASRQQVEDVHSRSVLVDPADFRQRPGWRGRPWESAVIFELHVGTFTKAGTLDAARDRLHALADLGVTAVELMPLGQFPGTRGWGYDVVLPFAIHTAYGSPLQMSRFVQTAHDVGLMVLVDVVYNHFGPEGAVLSETCPSFFDPDRQTPWGPAIDFEKPEVNSYFLDNAKMWLTEYGVDGLRLDAVHHIGKPGETRFLHILADHVTALDLDRPIHIVAEDERNLVRYVEKENTIRAQWNDDYHHAIHCLLTTESQSYYAPFSVDPFGDLATALRDGQVDQGQKRLRANEVRGEKSSHLPPIRFVNANQTHDQIGNRAFGERLLSLADVGTMQTVHALLLLAPFIPMLFMGEESGARTPFQFFTDFDGELADAVRKGRKNEFPEFANATREPPDPNAISTLRASRPYDKLPDDAEAWRDLTRHCLGLRRDHIVPKLRSGWIGETVERLSDRSLWVQWSFQDGTLEIAFTLEGPPSSLSRMAREIYYQAAESGASIRVGVGDRA